MARSEGDKPTRLCRTRDECFRAGWDDGAEDAPLTQAETDKVIALLNLSQPDRSQ